MLEPQHGTAEAPMLAALNSHKSKTKWNSGWRTALPHPARELIVGLEHRRTGLELGGKAAPMPAASPPQLLLAILAPVIRL